MGHSGRFPRVFVRVRVFMGYPQRAAAFVRVRMDGAISPGVTNAVERKPFAPAGNWARRGEFFFPARHAARHAPGGIKGLAVAIAAGFPVCSRVFASFGRHAARHAVAMRPGMRRGALGG